MANIEHITTFDDYQSATQAFVRYQCGDFVYPALGLAGEAGEVADKVKKVIRDKEGTLDYATRREIAFELGDVLWYLAREAEEMGYTLAEIATMNIDKLNDRKIRGTLQGSGDNR